jgi:hypothetical protein
MNMPEDKQPCGSRVDFRNAPCAGLQELFFDSNNSKKAKMLCLNCDFRQECRELAGSRAESFGIWGGVNFYNRRERERFLKEYKLSKGK